MSVNFSKDLAKGQKTQDAIFQQLLTDGWKCVDGDRMSRYDGEYSLRDRVDLGTVRIEVKNELKYGDYPTCFVEYRCNNKNSGIRASRADVFIHIMKDECFIYSKDQMLEFYWREAMMKESEGKDGVWEYKKGGDSNYSKGILVNRRYFVSKYDWVVICQFEDISSELKRMLAAGLI